MQIALPILVYQATGSVTSTAAMMIVGLVPAVLLSPVAGVLADRVDRRLLLLGVCLGQLLVGVVDGARILFDGQAALYVVAGVLALAHQHRHRLRDARLAGSPGRQAAQL